MLVNQVSYIKEAVTAYASSKPPKDYLSISPYLGGCPRVHYLKLKGVAPTTPPSENQMVAFQVGHIWEAFMARCLENQGILSKWYRDGIDEPFYLPALNLGGTPDYLLEVDGELVVADCKTMRSEWFWYRTQAAKRGEGLQQWVNDNYNYVLQLGSYILLLRQAGLDVNKGVLAFVSKDDGFVGMELEITMSPALEAQIKDRCDLIQHHLVLGTLPPCECEGWKVGYCDYGDPDTRVENKKKKIVNTVCCDPLTFGAVI